VELKEAEGSKKRKRVEAGGKPASSSRRGEHSHGRIGGSKVEKVVAVKIPASSDRSPVVSTKLESMTVPALWPSAIRGSRPGQKMPNSVF